MVYVYVYIYGWQLGSGVFSYVSTELGLLKSSLKGWQEMTSAMTPRS